MKTLALLAAFGLTVSSFASTPWGSEEMKVAGAASFTAFEMTVGADKLDAITEYRVKMSSQKNSARAYITYKDANGEDVTEKFFCHNHGDEIDCH